MTAVTRPTKMYAASCVMEGTHVAALPKSVHADTPKAGDEAKTAIVANACAVRVMRNLTVKLRGRTEAPHGAESAQFSAPEAPSRKRITAPSNDCSVPTS
jgi:hypothetical protein